MKTRRAGLCTHVLFQCQCSDRPRPYLPLGTETWGTLSRAEPPTAQRERKAGTVAGKRVRLQSASAVAPVTSHTCPVTRRARWRWPRCPGTQTSRLGLSRDVAPSCATSMGRSMRVPNGECRSRDPEKRRRHSPECSGTPAPGRDALARPQRTEKHTGGDVT